MTHEPSALVGLLERVEGATGPDRELDVLIECVLFGGAPNKWDAGRASRKDSNGHGYTQAVAPYTALLTSTVTLVERALPGWVWSVGNLASGGGHAYLMRAQGAALIGGGKFPTPALALLAALLRALLADAERSGGGV